MICTTYPCSCSPRVPTSLPYYDSRSTPPPPFSPICLLAYKDTCPKYSPIKLFIRTGMVHPLPLPSALKPWGEQGGARYIVRAKAGSYSCHREDTICIDSSVGIILCGRRQRPIEYLPPMAGGGGPHNKSPRWGSGLLGGGWGVVFADWNAPALGGILDQQGFGNVGNSTTYQPST